MIGPSNSRNNSSCNSTKGITLTRHRPTPRHSIVFADHFMCLSTTQTFCVWRRDFLCKIFSFSFFRFVIQCISFCVINVCTQFTTTSQEQPIHFAFLPHLMRQVSRKNVKNAFSRINKYWRVFVASSSNDKMAVSWPSGNISAGNVFNFERIRSNDIWGLKLAANRPKCSDALPAKTVQDGPMWLQKVGLKPTRIWPGQGGAPDLLFTWEAGRCLGFHGRLKMLQPRFSFLALPLFETLLLLAIY